MSKRADLGAFIATKSNAAPAALHEPPPPRQPQPQPSNDAARAAPKQPVPSEARPVPAPKKKPVPEVEVEQEMVLLNARVPASFRLDLKLYAASIGKSMQQIVMEGVELHRQKAGKAKSSIT